MSEDDNCKLMIRRYTKKDGTLVEKKYKKKYFPPCRKTLNATINELYEEMKKFPKERESVDFMNSILCILKAFNSKNNILSSLEDKKKS